MFCPSCAGKLVMVTGWVRMFLDDVATATAHLPFAYCEQCPLVTVVDPKRGLMADLNVSMSLAFAPQQPRVTLVDIPTFKGRTES